jgi:hypothetical protein
MNGAMNAAAMYGGLAGPYNITSAQSAYFADTGGTPSSGAPASVNSGAAIPSMGMMAEAPMERRGILGKPSTWWVMLFLVGAAFVFISRRFGGPEKFGNIKLTLWNAVFAVIFYVLVLNFLKVVFAYLKIPGLSELVANA